jgi:hypothetical protein
MLYIRPTLITALVLLTACGGSGDHRTASADSTAVADTTAAMPPGHDMAGHSHEPQAGDTTLTLRPDGMGPMRVGMTAHEADLALGDFNLAKSPPGVPVDSMACTYAKSARLGPGVKVMVEGARVVRVEVDSGRAATAEGARIGDTEARIQQLYPGRVTVGPHKYTDGHYLTVRPAEAGDTTHLLIFETDGNAVLRFRGGQKPQVEYVEGCS